METKILFFDIDGTLSAFRSGVPESAKIALKKAKEKGHRIFVCSGRCPAQIDQEILDLGFDGIIGNNGAYVSYRNEIVFDGSFKPEDIKHLVGICNENNIPFMVQCIKNTMIEKRFVSSIFKRFRGPAPGENEKNTNFFKSLKKGIEVSRRFLAKVKVVDDFTANPVNYKEFQKLCFFNNPISYEALMEKLEGRYEVSGMSYEKVDASAGEITLQGVNKGSGMGRLIDYLGVDRKDTIAFGDGPNDFEMIEFAAYSVVMGNGIPELKEKADFVTDDVSEDGLYNAMVKLELI